jgi:opacity protein-like surface antigen
MRRILLAAVMLGAAAGAQAADVPDLPILRGAFTGGPAAATVDWQGYYIGGQWGYGSSDENFGRSPSPNPLLLGLLAERGISGWPTLNLGKVSHRSSGGGAFAGYNSQWEDVVVGVEASYLHGGFGGSDSNSFNRFQALADGNNHDITSISRAFIDINDMLTLRIRGAYQCAFFLPYLFGGVALGNADIGRSATLTDNIYSPLGLFLGSVTRTAQEIQHSHLIYGYSAGLGVDMMLYHGLFARAEWEYVRFTSSVDTSINTVRLGLGYKF